MNIIKYSLISIIIITNFAIFSLAANASLDTPTSLNFTPEVSIPGSVFTKDSPIQVGTPITTVSGNTTTVKMSSDLLSKYIQALYNYSLAIVAILAAIVLMGGGLLWLTSRGDSGGITKAKEMILGSITGLAILFCAWIILNTVNPELLKLKPIETVIINKLVYGCCDRAKDDKTTKMTVANNCENNFDTKKTLILGKCEPQICCVYSDTYLGNPFSYCFTSFSNSCSLIGKAVVSQTSCSEKPECQRSGAMITCAGIKDGEVASGNFAKDRRLLCYNGIIYSPDSAALSEPCGLKTVGYGICVNDAAKCNDTNQSGGRLCGNDLKCCLD